MARKAFYSFHYKPDNWRASQVRNMGVVEGNTPVSDNSWESVTKGGDAAIEKWIAEQLDGRSCTIVLVGENTAGRKWITYEIIESWNKSKGVVGVRIHGLKNRDGDQGSAGANPFDYVTLKKNNKPLSSIVKLYDPPYTTSTGVYDYIKKTCRIGSRRRLKFETRTSRRLLAHGVATWRSRWPKSLGLN